MESLRVEIGRALRRLRRSRGLKLRDVSVRSSGRFKPTSVAGYERAERSISLERFVEICRLYEAPPERVLGDVMRTIEGRVEPEIDLATLGAISGIEAGLISAFVHQVRSLRGEGAGDRIILREGDLEVLATAAGKRPDELAQLLRIGVRREPEPE
jgi:transcriptional regulator with XRE-family HTH domain